jgi:N-acetylneuraminic acid mutarotase
MARSAALLLVLIFITAPIIKVNPVSAPSAIENTWTTKAPIPQEIGIVGAAVVNGKIYVMGGSSSREPFNYEYDPETDNWVAKTPMPTPRASFGIATYQNKIYTIGGSTGWTQETGTIYSGANEVYDPSTNTWENKKPMPTNRSGIEAYEINGKVILIGSYSDDIYDIATDSWTTKKGMPYAVSLVQSAVIDDKVYLISPNITQIYDAESDTWSLGAAAPIRVSTPGICATTGIMAPKRIYVFGGSVGFLNYTDVTQVYDPKSDTWTLGEPMPTSRGAPATAVVNDQIYTIGGQRYWGRTETTNELYIPFGYGTPDPSYDGTPPEITMISPENKTYHKTSIPLEFSVNEPVSWMRYELDNENITEISGNTTITGLSFGSHNLTVYATDAAGNTGVCQTIHFKVAEEPFPTTLVIASVITVAVVIAGLFAYFKKRSH